MKSLRSVGRSILGEGLRAQVLRGGVWLGAGSTIEQVLRFVRNMALTRLLLPEAFGTMAIVISVSGALESFTQMGIKEAVVQNPRGSEDSRLNVAWWLSAGRGVLLFGAGWVCAPLVASFYKNPSLAPLLRVAMLSVLLTGLWSPRAYAALKEMRFSRWAMIYHGGALAGILLTIVLALLWRSVWALAIGFTAEAVGRLMVSFVLGPYWPRLHLDREALREILKFSSGMFGLAVLAFVCTNVDVFVIGKMFSSATLGVYGMAVTLAQAPASFALNLLAQLAVPAFARAQTNDQRTNRMLVSMTTAISFGCFPMFVFAGLYARPLLTLIYGNSYAEAEIPFALTCGVAMTLLINSPLTAILFARGLPQVHWRFLVSRTVVLVALIVPLVKWFGVMGAPLAAVLAVLVGYLFQLERIFDLTGLELRRYARPCIAAAGISLAVVGIRLGATLVTGLDRPAPALLVGMGGCGLAYFFCWMWLRDSIRAVTTVELEVVASTHG